MYSDTSHDRGHVLELSGAVLASQVTAVQAANKNARIS